MTSSQINVFIEERKWDYRGNLNVLPANLPAHICPSVRVRCRFVRAAPIHWLGVLDFEPNWCSHVGAW